MPPDPAAVVRLVCDLAQEENLQVTLKESLKGGVIAGASTVAGAVLLGPIGLIVGSTIGGVTAYMLSKGKFVSAAEVIANMNADNRAILANRVGEIMQGINVTDVAAFAAIVAGDQAIRHRVMLTVVDHLTNEMRMAVANY